MRAAPGQRWPGPRWQPEALEGEGAGARQGFAPPPPPVNTTMIRAPPFKTGQHVLDVPAAHQGHWELQNRSHVQPVGAQPHWVTFPTTNTAVRNQENDGQAGSRAWTSRCLRREGGMGYVSLPVATLQTTVHRGGGGGAYVHGATTADSDSNPAFSG